MNAALWWCLLVSVGSFRQVIYSLVSRWHLFGISLCGISFLCSQKSRLVGSCSDCERPCWRILRGVGVGNEATSFSLGVQGDTHPKGALGKVGRGRGMGRAVTEPDLLIAESVEDGYLGAGWGQGNGFSLRVRALLSQAPLWHSLKREAQETLDLFI